MKKDTKQVETMSEKDAIRNYLKQQYRPYCLGDLMLNLKTKLGKQKMVVLLNELADNGDIICKSIGKLVYYVYKQRLVDELEPVDTKELDCLSLQINDFNQELKKLKASMGYCDIKLMFDNRLILFFIN